MSEKVDEAYRRGYQDAREQKYPGATRAEVAKQVSKEFAANLKTQLMTLEFIIETAAQLALDKYVEVMGFAPDTRKAVLDDTYPGLLAGNGYSPMVDGAIVAFRDRLHTVPEVLVESTEAIR